MVKEKKGGGVLIKPSKIILYLTFYLSFSLDAEKTPILGIPAIILPRLCTYKFSFCMFSSAGDLSGPGFVPVLSDSFAVGMGLRAQQCPEEQQLDRDWQSGADGTGSVQLPAPPGAPGTWNVPWKCPLCPGRAPGHTPGKDGITTLQKTEPSHTKIFQGKEYWMKSEFTQEKLLFS